MIDCDPTHPRNLACNISRPAAKKRKKIKRRRINSPKKYRPGVYVDASHKCGHTTIVAVIVLGSFIVAYRRKRYLCQSSRYAEYNAITLGDQVRGPNKHLTIFSDSQGCSNKHPAENVRWIQRLDNKIAHKLTQTGSRWVLHSQLGMVQYP